MNTRDDSCGGDWTENKEYGEGGAIPGNISSSSDGNLHKLTSSLIRDLHVKTP